MAIILGRRLTRIQPIAGTTLIGLRTPCGTRGMMVDRVRHGIERLTHGGKFLTIVLRELDAEILLRDLPELERHLLKRPQPPHHSEEHDRCDGKQKQNAGDHIRRGDLI